jgi:hypothetical protein
VYATTEQARLMLRDATDDELAEARTAAGEAAYYLSDTIDPDERANLLRRARRRLARAAGKPGAVADRDAFALLTGVAGEVEGMLRGPSASAELHIALRALRRATGSLASHLGVVAGQPDAAGLRPQRRGALGRLHARHQ